jgi:hypothetical protein
MAPEKPALQFTKSDYIELIVTHNGLVRIGAPTSMYNLSPKLASDILFGRWLDILDN